MPRDLCLHQHLQLLLLTLDPQLLLLFVCQQTLAILLLPTCGSGRLLVLVSIISHPMQQSSHSLTTDPCDEELCRNCLASHPDERGQRVAKQCPLPVVSSRETER